MMMGALGIKIPEADIKALEELLPKVPALVINATNVINEALKKYDARLMALEKQNEKLIALVEALQHGDSERGNDSRHESAGGAGRPNGSGGTRKHR